MSTGRGRQKQLDGVAKVDGETLSFEDEVYKVKGIIIVQDNKAELTITESGFEYINQGEVFEFPEKLATWNTNTMLIFNIMGERTS